MNLRGFNKYIFVYILEILFVVSFMIFTFFAFDSKNLKSYAMEANNSYRFDYNGQTAFKGYDANQLNEINEDKLLIAGTLSVRNPNENGKSYKVVLNLDNSTLENIEIFINGSIINATLSDNGIIILDEVNLNAYSNQSYDILVYTDNIIDNYSFDLV